MEQFNALFDTVHRGDEIAIDFLADGSTEVWFNQTRRGAISGTDFQTAVLKVWLGDSPADYGLRSAMLGESAED